MSDDATTPARRRTRAKKAPKPQTASDLTSLVAGKVASPRQTLPTNANILGSFPYAFLPRRQYQNVDLSSLNVSVLSPQQVIDLLSDADPDVSLAWWNFLLLTVGHWETDARTADDKEDAKAKSALNAILAKVNAQWGGFQNVLYQFVMSILLEGACAGECILTDDLKDVRDVVSVTPWTIYFQRDSHQDLVVFQWQPMTANGLVDTGAVAPTIANVEAGSYGAAGFRPLNTTTFGYVPFMPMTDDPYGRMPFASIFQVIVFDNQLLQDLRRWAHVNAWGRIDVAIVQEMVQALMPPAVAANKNEMIAWINTYIGDVAKAYSNVGPDDSFIHLDNVHVTGVDSSGKTFNIDNLIHAVERKKFRALRMLPILMGSNEGTTETHGTVQWDIMVRGLEAIQDCVATLANTLLTTGLRTLGYTSHAVVEFETVRSTDQMVEAQAEAIQIANAARKRDEGWITQDEASIEVTGSAAVADAPNPDPLVALGQPDSGSVAPLPPPDAPQEPTDGPNPDDTKDAATLDSANPDGKATPVGKATKARLSPPERAIYQDILADLIPEVLYADDSFHPGAYSGGRPDRAEVMNGHRDPHPGPALAAPILDPGGAALATMAAEPPDGVVERNTHRSQSLATRATRGPSPQRHALTELLRSAVRGHFAGISIPRALAEQFIGFVPAPRARYVPAFRTLTEKQQARLRTRISTALAAHTQASRAQLAPILAEARKASWNAAGQDALDQVSLDGEFDLTNADLLSGIDDTAQATSDGTTETFLGMLTGAIITSLLGGADATQLEEDIASAIADLSATRADIIAQTETASAWGDASLATWDNNGVPMKVWVTTGDPDPGAGKNGATPCRDNAYASPIAIDEDFPSGDSAPPAHTNCACWLEASGDPSDAALANPWTGGEIDG